MLKPQPGSNTKILCTYIITMPIHSSPIAFSTIKTLTHKQMWKNWRNLYPSGLYIPTKLVPAMCTHTSVVVETGLVMSRIILAVWHHVMSYYITWCLDYITWCLDYITWCHSNNPKVSLLWIQIKCANMLLNNYNYILITYKLHINYRLIK